MIWLEREKHNFGRLDINSSDWCIVSHNFLSLFPSSNSLPASYLWEYSLFFLLACLPPPPLQSFLHASLSDVTGQTNREFFRPPKGLVWFSVSFSLSIFLLLFSSVELVCVCKCPPKSALRCEAAALT